MFRALGATVLGSCLAICQPQKLHAAAPAGSAVLEFLQPTNGAVFSTRDEIPIVLRGFAPDDVFPTADVLANNQKIATASYCCSFCPCAAPQKGQETILQIPAPWVNGRPPPHPWQGWTNARAGYYPLTAKAVGLSGTAVEAAPIWITVLDLTLHIGVQPDGTAVLVIPEGSLVPGGYDLEASDDLHTWTRLGPFEPGNVAAFYFDPPPTVPRAQRFYRSVHILPPAR